MNTRILTVPLLLTLLNTSAWAQGNPPIAEAGTARPLNLSLPGDVLRTPPAGFRPEADDLAVRNLRPGPVDGTDGTRSGGMRYGSGYEARQRSAGSGSVSGGGGGRGGMGRRR